MKPIKLYTVFCKQKSWDDMMYYNTIYNYINYDILHFNNTYDIKWR